MQTTCPNCGTLNRPNARFCVKCGTPLAAAAPGSTPSQNAAPPTPGYQAPGAMQPIPNVPNQNLVPPVPAAGARPKANRALILVAALGLCLCVLIVASGFGIYQYLQGALATVTPGASVPPVTPAAATLIPGALTQAPDLGTQAPEMATSLPDLATQAPSIFPTEMQTRVQTLVPPALLTAIPGLFSSPTPKP